ncbi:hypothetical protein Ddye_031465 [Dipteronia dyeriana]|uniref:BAHD acyltransferase n=1 Tax=Dipteronia dyeriana TaxID=168575 RepID=A0AAD9TIX0_9ROSI|nr:hypothetical protein Ddye_031465 [Dipteronia dyeriana]
MKIQITARETLKPSSPTPQSLRDFKLSLIDQLIPPVYVSTLLFYPFINGGTNNHFERSEKLKKSFSDTLTLFYPLAGKTVDNITIDCSDYGALYVEARVDCALSEFLQQSNWDQLGEFIPIKDESTEESVGFFSAVQASFFDCGGVAIAMSILHKLADAATAAVAMRCWAVTTFGSADAAETVVPLYKSAEIFPPMRFFTAGAPPLVDFKKEKLPRKRLVFEASKIAALKALAVSESVERPTSAESVTALIWKCALNAARSNSGVSRPSILIRAVNIRRKIEPPLPDNSVGNLVGFYTAEKDESETELNGLVSELRDKLKLFDNNYVKMLQQEDAFEAVTEYLKASATQMMRHDMEFYICTTWCNFSFYDIDFGWGRPVWVTMGSSGYKKNVIELLDTNKGDGSIEAWVVLSEQDMYLFERDPELLAYASLNPSVLDT